MSTETTPGTLRHIQTEQSPNVVPIIIAATNITAEQVKRWGQISGAATMEKSMAFMKGGMLKFGHVTLLIDHDNPKEPERKLQSAYVISPLDKDESAKFTLVVPQVYLSQNSDKHSFTKFVSSDGTLEETHLSVREETDPLILEALSRSESDLWGLPDLDKDFYDVHHGLSPRRKPGGQFIVDG